MFASNAAAFVAIMRLPYVNCALVTLSIGLTTFVYGPTAVLGAAIQDSAPYENPHPRDGPPINDDSDLAYHGEITGNADQRPYDTVPKVPESSSTSSESSVTTEGHVTTSSIKTVPTTTAVTTPVTTTRTNCTYGACGESTTSVTVTTKKVKIVVIYESHCPYSRRFVHSQLYPTYKLLGKYLNVTILPFGKASSWNETDKDGHNVIKFHCQHGPNECEGNKLEACTVKVVKETLVAIQIIACMSESFMPHKVAKDCVEKAGVQWRLIETCFNKDGDALLYEMAKETWKVKAHVDRVPLVVVDGQMDNYVEVMAQKDLLGLTCGQLGSTNSETEKICSPSTS